MSTRTTIRRALLLLAVVLTAQLCGCAGNGFSVELIHRDSVKSPYHDPSLTAHARVLAAVRRSTARAAALARSDAGNGALALVVLRPYEYHMALNVGTPPTRMHAVVDTGSSLVWLSCYQRGVGVATYPSTVFDPSSSSTFARVGCNSTACHALHGASSCDANSHCGYLYGYDDDGSTTKGVLSTETFTFDDAVPGGCPGCRDHLKVVVPNVTFGCSTYTSSGSLLADGVVGLDAGDGSLIAQLGADTTTFGRRFSYCLAPYYSKVPSSSALNFGDRAVVTEPGAATTALIRSDGDARYFVQLESVKIRNNSYQHLSRLLVDSGTMLTFLDKAILDPIVYDLNLMIGLPTTPSPDILQLCYDVSTKARKSVFLEHVPDVTLYLAVFAEAVTLKAENMFAEVQEGTACLMMAPTTDDHPLQIMGNFAQQNMHVGYDLDKATVTFAPADCASFDNSPPVHG